MRRRLPQPVSVTREAKHLILCPHTTQLPPPGQEKQQKHDTCEACTATGTQEAHAGEMVRTAHRNQLRHAPIGAAAFGNDSQGLIIATSHGGSNETSFASRRADSSSSMRRCVRSCASCHWACNSTPVSTAQLCNNVTAATHMLLLHSGLHCFADGGELGSSLSNALCRVCQR